MGEIVRFRATTKVHPTLGLILALIAIEANFFTNFRNSNPNRRNHPFPHKSPPFRPGTAFYWRKTTTQLKTHTKSRNATYDYSTEF